MKDTLLCFLFFIWVSFSVKAQFSIQGTIRANKSKARFVNVQINSSSLGVTSDENGFFKVDGLKKGSYKLSFSSVEYIPFDTIILVESNVSLNIDLKAKYNELQGITISANLKPTYVSKSPVKVEIMTQKQLNLFLPSANSSLTESVALMPGVQEVVACGVCFTNNISINGLDGPYTAVLIDGMPMFGNLASVYGLNGIPNAFIEQIEVIKGPSSTLYGSEAVGGVINVITKKSNAENQASIDLMLNSNEELFANLAFEKQAKHFNYMLGLNSARMHNFKDFNNDFFNDMINLDRYSLFQKFDFKRKSGQPFTLSSKLYYEDRRNGVQDFLSDYKNLRGNDSIYGESIYTKRLELFGSYHFNSKEEIRLDYSVSLHDQNSYYGDVSYIAKQNTAFFNLIHHKQITRHELTSGLTFRTQYYNDNTIATPQAELNYIPGVFCQDEIPMHKKLKTLIGLRADYYSEHKAIFSPRLSVKYDLNSLNTLRLNVGTGFRIVNLFTEDHAFVTGQRTVEIKEDILPEQSINTTLNYHKLLFFNNTQLTLDLDAFYTYFTNKINPDYSEAQKIIYQNSSGHSTSKGVSLSINQQSKALGINANITLQQVTETEIDENNIKITRALEFAPKWTAMLAVSYLFEKIALRVSYNNQFTGPMQLPEVFDIDQNGQPLTTSRPTLSQSFSLHNIKLEKTINKKISIYGGIVNLLSYRQALSPLVGINDPNASNGFSAYFDTAYAFSPIEGREYYLGVILNLSKNK